MGSLAAGSAFMPILLFSERFLTLGPAWCSQQLILDFPYPALELASSPESGSFLGDRVWVLIPGRVTGDFLSQTEPAWKAPQGPRSCPDRLPAGQASRPAYRARDQPWVGTFAPRPPALLAGLQVGHAQWHPGLL